MRWREEIEMFEYVRKIRNKLMREQDINELLLKGLRIGRNFNRQKQVIIDYSHCWLIKIGDDVTLAPRVHILAHDASTKNILNYTKIGLVNIGNKVFIGAGSIVLPNVTIGDNVIIGSGSVVTKNIPSNVVAAGNPAKIICTLAEYLEKNEKLMKERPLFGIEFTDKNITNDQKAIMMEKLKDGIGFVK